MMIKTGLIFAFGAMISWAVGDFFVQKTTKRLGNYETLAWINLIGVLGLTPLVVFNFGSIKSWENIFTLFILGIIDFVFGLLLLKAFEKGKLSVVEAVMTMELPFTILFGIFFLNEHLTPFQTIVILIILSGIVLISRGPLSIYEKFVRFFTGKNWFIEKGVILAFIAALVSAVYNFLIAVNAREISPVMAIWFPWLISSFFLFAYISYKKGIKAFLIESKESKKIIFFGSIIDTIAWVCFAAALSKNELSITTAITESYPALAMFLGIKFNREKITKPQFIGAAIAIVGSIIISLTS